MRLLLFLPTAVAAAQSLRVTPAVVDVHGGVEIELARDGSATAVGRKSSSRISDCGY